MMIIAEFRVSIWPATPQIIALLSDNHSDVRRAAVDALSELSEQGTMPPFLIWCC